MHLGFLITALSRGGEGATLADIKTRYTGALPAVGSFEKTNQKLKRLQQEKKKEV